MHRQQLARPSAGCTSRNSACKIRTTGAKWRARGAARRWGPARIGFLESIESRVIQPPYA